MATVRSAEPRDFADVTRLLAELGRPAVPTRDEPRARELYERQLSDPGAHHLVAEDDAGSVVGFCSAHVRERLNLRGPELWIPDLIVTAAARGHGVGRALLEEAEERGRSAGCTLSTLESGYERSEAHALYASAGMTDGGKFLWKVL